MPFHHLMYKVTAGVNDTNVAMTGVSDSIFTLRSSNNFMFSERMQWLAAMHLGVSVLRVRTNIPSWNTYGRHQVWPVNRSATPPSFPRIDDYRDSPLLLPTYEDVGFEESGNLGAATEQETLHLWLGTMDWSRRVPRGQFRETIRATATVTTVAAAWAGATAIVLDDQITAGWYAVIGAYLFNATARAFRLIFPKLLAGAPKQYRPGSYVTNAVGNLETPAGSNLFNDDLGVWGVFHTADLPQVELYDDAAAARSCDLRLSLAYLGGGDPGSLPSIA
jgi:hypothetical protein